MSTLWCPQLMLCLLWRRHSQSGGNVISPSHTMLRRRKSPAITAYYPAGYNCHVNMVETKKQIPMGSSNQEHSKESHIWPIVIDLIDPTCRNTVCIGSRLFFCQVGGWARTSSGGRCCSSTFCLLSARSRCTPRSWRRGSPAENLWCSETLLGNLNESEVFKGIFGILLTRSDLR